jgi:hypothetical protein
MMQDDIGMACSAHGEKIYVNIILVVKPEGKILLGNPIRSRLDNISTEL